MKFDADLKPAYNIANAVGGRGGTGAQFERSITVCGSTE